MDTKDEALLSYLSFNLIGMVDAMKPHIKEGTDMKEVYQHANDVLEEMRRTMAERSESVSKSS